MTKCKKNKENLDNYFEDLVERFDPDDKVQSYEVELSYHKE
jgi:hypothetical protein